MQWVIVRCLISMQRQVSNFNVMCADDCVCMYACVLLTMFAPCCHSSGSGK